MTSPYSFFFFTATATTEIYTLSLHDALPICPARRRVRERAIRISLPVVRAVRERERLRREATGFPWFANTSAPIISSPSMSQPVRCDLPAFQGHEQQLPVRGG